jgi:hypothetical protein
VSIRHNKQATAATYFYGQGVWRKRLYGIMLFPILSLPVKFGNFVQIYGLVLTFAVLCVIIAEIASEHDVPYETSYTALSIIVIVLLVVYGILPSYVHRRAVTSTCVRQKEILGKCRTNRT